MSITICHYHNTKLHNYKYDFSSILIQEDVERKKSNASLFPTPHQILPPLIDSDSYPHDEKTWMSELPPEYSEKPQGILNTEIHYYIFQSVDKLFYEYNSFIQRW